MAPKREPLPYGSPASSIMPPSPPPPTQHVQLYNPDPDRAPPQPVIPPSMLINPLTGVEVLHFDEAILMYQAADVFYTKLGLMSQNMAVYGPACMVCRNAIAALRAAKVARRLLKPVLDEWWERLEVEKRKLGFGMKK